MQLPPQGSAPARSALLESLFPRGAIGFELRGPLAVIIDQLLPGERECVSRASPRRAQEFAAGRLCAAAALSRLGIPRTPILAGPSREPRWMSGVVGSITHTQHYFAAVAAPATVARSVGLDAEAISQVAPELSALVCTKPEERLLARAHSKSHQQLLALIFSAKEAFYKCQHPLTGVFLDFRDITIELTDIEANPGPFTVRASPKIPALPVAHGRYLFDQDLVLTGATLPPTPRKRSF
jgi:4'-phosphopantetheinyl transferase EntD